jgi:hypothetical protein
VTRTTMSHQEEEEEEAAVVGAGEAEAGDAVAALMAEEAGPGLASNVAKKDICHVNVPLLETAAAVEEV